MSRTKRNSLIRCPYRTPLGRNHKKQLIRFLDEVQSPRNRDRVLANKPLLGYDNVYCSAYRELINR